MATANFTGDEKHQTVEQPHCSAGFTDGLSNRQLIFILVLNISLSITAFLGNAVILAALRKESSLHPPSKLLLRNLATTDLCVGLISQPLAVTSWMSMLNEYWDICPSVLNAGFVSNYTLCGVSLLTLTAISVDRLLALLLGLRYKHVVTLKRTYVIVITFWVVSTVFSALNFWDTHITIWYGSIGITLCLVTSIFSYTTIFFKLRLHKNQVQEMQQHNQANQLNIARYIKAVSTALWLQFTLVVCYLPVCIVEALSIHSQLSSSVFLARLYTLTLLFLNSSLNPILYCWKIDEVRQAVKDKIRQVLCYLWR